MDTVSSGVTSPSNSVRKPVKTYFCGHCSKELTKTLFFQHRKLFYDRKTRKWSQQKVFESILGNDFDFTESENSIESCKCEFVFHKHRVKGKLAVWYFPF